jgi:hypothetical protein
MKIGRNAGSGRFTSISQATRHPKTHVVETVDKGDNGGGAKKPPKK